MKIWLDDIRDPPDSNWTVFRKVTDDLVELFFSAEEVSLDHDLGDDTETGYDFLRRVESHMSNNRCKLPTIHIHSMNPVGRDNMLKAIRSLKRMEVL
jgi:hypothetical protein